MKFTFSKGLCTLFICFVMSCSENGNTEGPILDLPTPPRPSPPAPSDLSIEFTKVTPDHALIKKCKYAFAARAPTKSEPVLLDGFFEDWLGRGRIYQDSLTDSRQALGLSSFGMHMGEEDLFFRIALDGVRSPEESIFIELYSGFFNQGSFELSERAVLEFTLEDARVNFGSGWIELDHKTVEMASGKDGTELRLSRNMLLHGVIASPLWGVRVSIGDKDGWIDYSSVVLNRGVDAEGFGFFEESGCYPDETQPLSFQYQEFVSKSVPYEQASPILELVRYTESHLGKVFMGEDFPVNNIPVLVTEKPVLYRWMKPIENFYLGGTASKSILAIQVAGGAFGLQGHKDFTFEANSQIATFEELLSRMVDAFFYGRAHERLLPLLDVFKSAVTSGMIKDSLGVYQWLEYIQRSEHITEEKLGVLLEDTVGMQTLSATALDVTEPEAFWQSLSQSSPEDDYQIRYLEESFNNIGNHEELSSFEDGDDDGLPDFFEIAQALNPAKHDSDGDGWSDLGELILKTDANSSYSKPSVLIADGHFGDFIDLMPGRIYEQTSDPSIGCDNASDLTGFTALLLDGELMVAVRLREEGTRDADSLKDPGGIRWEIELDLKQVADPRRVLVTRGGRLIEVRNRDGALIKQIRSALPLGIHALELVLSKEILDVADITKDTLLRISSYRNDATQILCDRSRWFQAFFKD